MKKPHHTGTYAARARKLRAAAEANPNTLCWRCGRTASEHPAGKWTAGHLIDGLRDGPLAPEWSTCNYAAGARRGNSQRAQTIARNW